MKLDIKKPRDFINPLLAKKSIDKTRFDNFIQELQDLTNLNQKESEEHQKNAVRDFLHKSFDYTLNTKGRIDLAIFKNLIVEVIIEAKSLDNKSEMIRANELNRKAFAEAIKYFFDERKSGNNNLKHIIILTAFEWFIFDAKDFEKLFWQDKNFRKIHDDYTNPNSLLYKTGDVYNEISKLVASKKSTTNLFDDLTIECAYFNLKDNHKEKDLIAIYKLLSPDSLLKEFNPNDANSLNREFYNELLYILGLEEVKNGGKKLISRSSKPQIGSFYENIADKLSQRGKNSDFETIIRLIIVWVNRILFLKLLESQIVSWNKNNEYKFLNFKKIVDFDALENLFFDVLAKKPKDRTHKEFDYIPYLNSSLFEFSAIEADCLSLSNLSDDAVMEYYSKTVIKDENTNRKNGTVSTLAYLFEFLDAYDFGSTSSDDIFAPTNKTLINASVLGLIFEKLNGYKDGSFYTPSFITMYMARESLQKSIIDRFNAAFIDLKAENWNELVKYCEKYSHKDEFIVQANSLIDSITVCDPAVGSGHFLVSVLNEIIYIKYQLGLLHIKGLRIDLANDELLIRLDDEWFEYSKPRDFKSSNHLLQKLLFEEKQRIIENQLFGVDINPNSTQITKLRLWIELLKNSYYDENYQLVTLPNIDINIKTGNSLISRFDLKDEIKINNIKQEIKNYKQIVKDYKENLGTKKEVLASIENLKDKFRLTLKAEYKLTKELEAKLKAYVSEYGYDKLSTDLTVIAATNRYGQTASLFGDEADAKKQAKLLGELDKLQLQIDEIEKGKIYENAFEWRFEFPEVLDENGEFVGFDIVIGNPPYIDSEAMSTHLFKEREYISNNYEYTKGNWDIYIAFFERSFKILNINGRLSFITPDKWIAKPFGNEFKNKTFNNFTSFVKLGREVFENAKVDSLITIIDKQESKKIDAYEINDGVIVAINTVEKNRTDAFNIDLLFSKNYPLILKMHQYSTSKVSNYGTVENACATSDAYRLKEILKNGNSQECFKVVNTGTISKYLSLYGEKEMTYLKDKYLFPCVDKQKFLEYFKNSYATKTQMPKLILKGLTLLDACIDIKGEIIPGKSTIIITEKNNDLNTLKFLLGLINSKFFIFYIKEMYASSSYNGGINFTKDMIGDIPIPQITADKQQPFIEIVDKIIELKKVDSRVKRENDGSASHCNERSKEAIQNEEIATKSATSRNDEIARLENQIDMMVYELYGLTDEEIAVVEGRG